MKDFKQLNITAPVLNFKGAKIKINKILNKEIVVEGYKIGDSKFEGKGDCLTLQIMVDNEQRVVFTSSKGLMGMIKSISGTDFPFKTTIVEVNEMFQFT